MSRIAMWLLVAGVLIGAVAGLWVASEMHYRNCLAYAQQESRAGVVDYGGVFSGVPTVPGANCSRWPF
jgi:hypothetical protein